MTSELSAKADDAAQANAVPVDADHTGDADDASDADDDAESESESSDKT